MKLTRKELLKLADGAYGRYIEQLSREECKGILAKMRSGSFGLNELEAHKATAGHFAVYNAMIRLAGEVEE